MQIIRMKIQQNYMKLSLIQKIIIFQYMSNSVVIGPLPQSINIAKVRQVFSPFITDKIILKKNKAYIRFTDPNDIQSLDMKYPGLTIPQLGNAQIDRLPEDFNWILIDSEEPKKKEVTTQEFIMSQKKQEPKPIKITPKFIVVTECDQKLVESAQQDYLRKKLFSKYQLGKIIRYKTNLYVEFLDENQIQTLQIQFPGLQVRDLGSRATINLAEDSFRDDLIRDQAMKEEMERKLEAEREEKLRIEKKREEQQREQIKRQQQKRMKSEEHYSSGSWSVRPEVERESLLNIQKKSGNTELFWALVMVIWGVYVIFM